MTRRRIFNKWLASTFFLFFFLFQDHSLASPALGRASSQDDQSTSNVSASTLSPAGGIDVDTVLDTPTSAPHEPFDTLIDGDDSNTTVIQSVENESDDTTESDGSEDSSDMVNQVTGGSEAEEEEEYPFAETTEEFDSDEWLLQEETCANSMSSDEDANPKEDTADLRKVHSRILEHVVGGPRRDLDPENLRMRAYVVQRRLRADNVLDEWHRSLAENGTIVRVLEEDPEVGGEAVRKFRAAVREAVRSSDSVLDAMFSEGGGEEIGQTTTQMTVVEGARLRLVCNVTGTQHYWVEWRRKAGLTFPDGSLVVGGRSVLLEYVGREDAGTYVCTARIAQGRTHSSALTIHVHYAPVVGVWVRSVRDTGVELGCLVEGRPRPSSAWYINNSRLSLNSCDGDLEMRSAMLAPTFLLSMVRVVNTTEANFAYYHCRASNAVGVSRAYAMVHDNSGMLNLHELKTSDGITYSTTTMDNPRLASFLLGMVPPLYIALYIIAYLSCYKTSISGMGGHGRFGANIDLDNDNQ